MTVTIKEIAKRTGLSVPTVGNVLGRAANRYSPDTRQRVLKAAQELGYIPNSSARAMRRGRFGCAALVLSRDKQATHSHIPSGLLDGLDEALAQHDMHLTVSRLTDEELSSENFAPKVLREWMADGMIVNYTHEIPRRMLDVIHAHHAPAVWLNAKLPSNCVYPDDFGAARDATKRLLSLGHRRIAMVHFISPTFYAIPFEQARPRFHYSVADRAAGFKEAMREAGLSPRFAHHDRYVDDREHLEECRALLSGPDRPTALILYSEPDLTAVLCAAAELGLSAPRDLSVMVFHPHEIRAAGRCFTAIPVPTREIGRRAVAMLMQKLEDGDRPCAPEAVPYTIPMAAECGTISQLM
jgi:LacI family transcriptional regulator